MWNGFTKVAVRIDCQLSQDSVESNFESFISQMNQTRWIIRPVVENSQCSVKLTLTLHPKSTHYRNDSEKLFLNFVNTIILFLIRVKKRQQKFTYHTILFQLGEWKWCKNPNGTCLVKCIKVAGRLSVNENTRAHFITGTECGNRGWIYLSKKIMKSICRFERFQREKI